LEGCFGKCVVKSDHIARQSRREVREICVIGLPPFARPLLAAFCRDDVQPVASGKITTNHGLKMIGPTNRTPTTAECGI